MSRETNDLQLLITQCKRILSQFIPELSADDVMFKHKMAELTHLKQSQKTLNPEQLNLLSLLEDLAKLRSLKPMEIPQKPPQSPLIYYVMMDEVGGVTEKLSLIGAVSLRTKLQFILDNADTVTMKNYHEIHGPLKLNTEAILKLPKHGNVCEVQREKMALDLSCLLGLQTTSATLMNYKGKPALFVPFDKITLLRDVATGKTMHGHLGSLKKYLHYSTINPVGEGLQANRFISEFGHSLGLFYLCSDTDAIGGYNQNKALKNNQLYVFDQVISLDDKLQLDSRLSMKPIKLITHHTRHDQGRNRTLIEDASIASKFQALTQLKNKRREVEQYCKRIIDDHKSTLHDLSLALKQPHPKDGKKNLNDKRKLITALLHDTEKIKEKLLQRIDKVDDVLLSKSSVEPAIIQQTLLLEKMLNYPILFTEDGRPYCSPWTNKNTTKAVTVKNHSHDDLIYIQFSNAIPKDIIKMIRRQMGEKNSDSWIHSEYELSIPKKVLLALTESTLFPEHEPYLDMKNNYLDVDDLRVIQHGYEGAHCHKIIELIDTYNLESSKDSTDILDRMDEMEKKLHALQNGSSNQGFIKHVLRKFQFDVQQRLQRMIPEGEIREPLHQAFNAAVQLDQVSSFNQVVREALHQGKLADPVFLDYLTTCIEAIKAATDHFSALKQSEIIRVGAKNTLSILKNEGHIIYQASLISLKKLNEIVPEKVSKQYDCFSPKEREDFKMDHPDLGVFLTLRHDLAKANTIYEQDISSTPTSAVAELGQRYKGMITQCFTDALASASPPTWKKIVKLLIELRRHVGRAMASFISSKPSVHTPRVIAEKKMSNKEIKSALIDIKDVFSPHQPRLKR